MADLSVLEHSMLKVPYEVLNRKYRLAQKTIDKEVFHVSTAINDLEKATQNQMEGENSQFQISNLLGGLVEKLKSLKRKAEDSSQEEIDCGRLIKKRLVHLKDHEATNKAILNQWNKTRVDRLITEFLLRAGFCQTAVELVDKRGIRDLCNVDIFLVAHEVEMSLKNKETSRCLQWCQDNKSKLKKITSSLEFNLRVQEFVELIKAEKRMEAVWHARKYFPSLDQVQNISIQQCMALIAFPADTPLSPYKQYFCDSRWATLIEQFREEHLKLYQVSPQSYFSLVLQAGLSALKTPHCYRGPETQNSDCPVCNPLLNELASPLPYAHLSQSKLVCYISGEPLNEHNQPLMLPNGYVYGQQALQKMANDNKGLVTCPRTHNTFNYNNAEKVYVM